MRRKTMKIEKTVFISYRRTNAFMALAIFKDLTAHGYDVFFDYTSIASGDFEQIIIANIKARAHFIVVLTPTALERCSEPGDWLRREIETALQFRRNIIPLLFDGFDFGNPSIASQLSGGLANLKKYNALRVPTEYFDAAMQRLRQDYLNIPLDAVTHPLSDFASEAARRQQTAAAKAALVQQGQPLGLEWAQPSAETTAQGRPNVAVLGDDTAKDLADTLRSVNIQVVNQVEGRTNSVVFAVDVTNGPMKVHRDILRGMSLTKNQEFLPVMTHTDLMDDNELLELVELELRELFTEHNLPGDDVVIWRYPKDANNLISYLEGRKKRR
jgi:hypothetical protein